MGNMVRTFWLQAQGEGAPVEVMMAEQAFAMAQKRYGIFGKRTYGTQYNQQTFNQYEILEKT
jgi:hypothetical protein